MFDILEKKPLINIPGLPWIIFIIGVFFRLINFPGIPSGLNQDEVAAGYEAFSILHTHADKWGNIFPAYFSAWGSGQSVLLSYLQIPFIHFLGLNVLSIRLPSVILGILILPLIYLVTKEWFDKKTALISLIMASLLPWPSMISRWGLEANILPFFTLLGLYLVTLSIKIYQKNKLNFRDKLIILFSFLPFSLGFYSYGLSLIPGFLFLLIFLVLYRRIITKHKWLAVSSIAIFILTSLPILFFIVKNNILGHSLFFEKYLPFSIPLLQSSRLNQINDDWITTIASNIYFVVAGFPDSISWNNDSVFLPLGLFSFPFFIIGLIILAKSKLINHLKLTTDSTSALALILILSFSPLLLFVPMNTTRSNSILYVVIIMIAFGITSLEAKIADSNFKKYFVKIIVSWIILYGLVFQFNYNFLYPKKVEAEFNRNIENTLKLAKDKSLPDEQVYLTKEVLINYVFPLFVFQIDPQYFRNNSQISLDSGGYNVYKFDNFVYDKDYLELQPETSWIAILKPCQNDWCDRLTTLNDKQKCYRYDTLSEDNVWKVVRCYAKYGNNVPNF